MVYNLTDYRISITIPPSLSHLTLVDGDDDKSTFTIGGEKSYLQSISVRQNNNLYTTDADDTGSWVHNKSLKRNGTVDISLNMISSNALYLRNLVLAYYTNTSTPIEGATITITDLESTPIVICNDCYPVNIPDMSFQATAQDQTWSFTCGEIIYQVANV